MTILIESEYIDEGGQIKKEPVLVIPVTSVLYAEKANSMETNVYLRDSGPSEGMRYMRIGIPIGEFNAKYRTAMLGGHVN